MQPIAALTTDLLALGTIAAQVLIVLLIGALVFRTQSAALLARVRPYIVPVSFVVTLAASLLTLVYSEVFGFAPCALCWLQRAFLYPMPIILGFALWKQHAGLLTYVFLLAIPGALVALYQHYLQVGGVPAFPCPAIPGAADCGKRLIFEFDYITFPLMAATVFVLVALMMLVARAGRRPL